MNIYYLINLIKRRLWILISIPVIAAICTLYIVINLPQSFRSNALIATGFTTDETVNLTDERFNPGKSAQDFHNLIEEMNSELVVTLVSYNLMLHDLTSETPFRDIEDELMDIPKPTSKQKQEWIRRYRSKLQSMKLLSSYDPVEYQMIEQLLFYEYSSYHLKERGLSIKRVGNSDYISIQFTSENPFLSAFVVNTLVDEFLQYHKSQKLSLTDESVSLLVKLVENKRQIFDQRKEILNSYKTDNSLINQKLENEMKFDQIMEYESKKQEEEKKIKALKLSTSRIKNKLDQYETEINNSNSKILKLRDEINNLNQKYVETGAVDEEIKSTIANLRQEMQLEIIKLNNKPTLKDKAAFEEELENYALQLQISQSNLRTINSSLASLKFQISSNNAKATLLEALNEEVEIAAKEYKQALDKYNDYKNKSLVIGNSIRKIKEGQPALEPEPAHELLLTGLAGFSSFTLCVILILLMELIDFRIKTGDNFRKIVDIDLAGTINSIGDKKLNFNTIFNEENREYDFFIFKQLMRKIRFEIEGTKAQTILITSTKIGEGKTFFILSLAYSLSLINKKILIIDTNFKNNDLTKRLLLHPGNKKLLLGNTSYYKLHTELLDFTKPAEESRDKQSVYSTNYPNIEILGSTFSTKSPREILPGKEFQGMLETFRNTYDYILLEGPALNDFPDTKELIEYVDIVLPIFSAESAIKQVDNESVQYLKTLNGRLMGAVLNKVENENLKI